MQDNEHKGFQRSLGLLDATMIVMGSMIGSGIFIVSADIARQIGSPWLLLLVWIVTGLLTLTAALSYGELAGMMPKAGGQYVYLREAYGTPVAFLYGWTLFTVIQTGTIAAVAVAFAKFTAVWIPVLSEKNILMDLGWLKISAAQLFAIASLLLLTFINLQGVRTGKNVQTFFTIVKVFALAFLIIAGFVACSQTNFFAQNFANPWTAFQTTVNENGLVETTRLLGFAVAAAFAVSMVGSLFSSDAWNNITFIAGEVKEPSRVIPRALALGTLGVTLIYVLANVVYLGLLPLQGSPDATDIVGRGIQFAESDRVGVAAANMIFGPWGMLFMASLIMLSTFACNNGLILAGARVYYAMAQDGMFFKGAGTLNANGVPGASLWWQCLWASLLCLSGTYGNLLDYVVFSVLIFYILTIYGVIRLRKTQPQLARPYKAIGYPYMQWLYIAGAAFICVCLLIYKPAYTWSGLGIVLAGLPVYYFTTRKSTAN